MELDQTYVWITTRRLRPGTRDEFSRAWRPSEFPDQPVASVVRQPFLPSVLARPGRMSALSRENVCSLSLRSYLPVRRPRAGF
jgi:hypothetical protein